MFFTVCVCLKVIAILAMLIETLGLMTVLLLMELWGDVRIWNTRLQKVREMKVRGAHVFIKLLG